jgi:hypothetical protein
MSKGRLTKFLLIAGLALAWLTVGPAAAPIHAGSITFITPTGSKSAAGEPVDVDAVLTTSSGVLQITVTNLEANPKDVADLVSDVQFTIATGSLTGSTLHSSSGQEITVHSGGTFTLGSTVPTGWVYSTSSTTSGELDVLTGTGHAGPAHLIIGAPGTGGTYSNANSSIAGNGPHNPFLNQSATFEIDGTNITADTIITSVTFSFGTTEGADNITAVPFSSVPEPSGLVLSVLGIGLVGSVVYRSRRRATTV